LRTTLTQGQPGLPLTLSIHVRQDQADRDGFADAKQKRIFAIIGVLIILLLGGLGLWGALHHDAYGTSAHGCVNVTLPSSTGGSTLHYCGGQAQAFCKSAFASTRPDLRTGQAAVRARRAGAVELRLTVGRHRGRADCGVTIYTEHQGVNPVVAEVVRSGFTESWHRGAVAGLDADGTR
jgi:hypothetical protein